jgi:hypothetical protein
MNEVYATFFKSGPPARATVEVVRPTARRENRDFGNRRASVVFRLRWLGGPYSRWMGCRCQKVTLPRFVSVPTERAPIRPRLWLTLPSSWAMRRG